MTLQYAIQTPRIDYRGIPKEFYGHVSAICRSYEECLDLRHWFGDDNFCPFLPVLLVIPKPDGTPFYGQIDGMGYASVWEIRDEAVARWEITVNRFAKTGSVIDFDALREQHGYLPREKVDAAIREGFAEQVRHQKANSRTEPLRQPKRPNPTGRTLHTVSKLENET